MAQAAGIVATYDAVGNREDLSDVIWRAYEGETPWYPPFARFLLLHFLVRRGDSVSASNPPIFNPLGAAHRHE